jgi:hypothetical protein
MRPGELTVAHVGRVVEVLALNGGHTRSERPLWAAGTVEGVTPSGHVIVCFSAATLQLINAKRKPARPRVAARFTVPVGLARWPQRQG